MHDDLLSNQGAYMIYIKVLMYKSYKDKVTNNINNQVSI
jgi:hypothetical protein